MHRVLAIGLAAFIGWISTPAATAAPQPVDLELVLAIDVSGSVDHDEAKLQRQGYVDALRDPEIHKAIKSGILGKIAITYFEWSSLDHKAIVAPWTLVDSPQTALQLASHLAEAPIRTGMRTSITGAILFAMTMFDENAFEGTRRVIDISGDGPSNEGGDVQEARDAALAKGIVINGLPIINDRPNRFGFPVMQDLDKYYEGCVTGGPGSFVIVAQDFDTFAVAIRRKMLLEIASVPTARKMVSADPSLPRLRRVQDKIVPYHGGCDIGERQSRDFWRNRFGP